MTEQCKNPLYSQALLAASSTDGSCIRRPLTWNLDINFVQGGYEG